MEKNDPRTWSYEDALNNFDEFCNYFDAASASAAERTSRPTHPSGTAGDRITQVEKDFWPKALRHAALRFWLSRLHDKYFPTDGELTHILDPNEFKSIFIDRVENPYKLIL